MLDIQLVNMASIIYIIKYILYKMSYNMLQCPLRCSQ